MELIFLTKSSAPIIGQVAYESVRHYEHRTQHYSLYRHHEPFNVASYGFTAEVLEVDECYAAGTAGSSEKV